MRICLILLITLLSGCTQPTVRPEPIHTRHNTAIDSLDNNTKEVIGRLVWSRIEPVDKELDPFRRQ